MGFLSGPSQDVLLKIAHGIAAAAIQIQLLKTLDEKSKKELMASLKSQGLPTGMDELTVQAARVVIQHKMGWYKRNQFLGMIFGSLVSMGMPQMDATYIKGQIELLAQT